MIAHGSTPEDIAGQYQSDLRAGLTSQRAAELRRQHGENRLTSRPPRSLAARFFDQFRDVMIWILLAAAAISFAVAIAERNAGELVEPALILAIVIANAAMGVAQESRAEKALEALKQLSAPHARVVRDGAEQSIDAAELVPGDLILLEAGDYAPADGRLIESASLRADESALTGESVPAEKDARAAVPDDAPLGDRRNMVHSGCPIAYGRGRAIVTATGMATEMGRIAGLLEQSGEEATPLQKKLAQLGKYLGLAAVAACAVIFAVGLLNGIPILEIFMVSVSLAVSAIPEGLPAIVTVVLALGVQRMVRRNAIIRRLTAVETLGGASVICSDKTGTLTQNRMTLVRAYVDGVGPEDISDHNGEGVRRLLTLAALCSDASIALDGDQVRLLGDPTETSIVMAARQNGIDKADLAARHPRLAELPFDSGRKRMTTVHRLDGKLVAVVKGAFDVLAARCTSGDLDAARQANDQMGGHALRVLAVAVRHLDAVPTDPQPDDVERDLTLVGLVGMIDPPRPEAGRAVEVCRRAGIKPVMITGDHVATARAIAGQLDILREGDAAITGAQLAGMSDEQLDRDVRGISVYARVSPEDKIRIVRAWQRAGEVVAMTGDGVNDAPALKAADIGCAMGITGTDVAKGAADMTLTDDNFATIVDAVREGRGIYENIKKAVAFLLGTNIGEVLTVFCAMLMWHRAPLVSMQLLWINLVTDSLPAIALGMEPVEAGAMERPPRPAGEGLFAHGLGLRVGLQGALFAALTLTGYFWGWRSSGDPAIGQTWAFIVLALSQVLHAFNMRSMRSLFAIGPFGNRQLNRAALISAALIALVLFVPPLRNAFELRPLAAQGYLISVALAAAPVPLMELYKAISRAARAADR